MLRASVSNSARRFVESREPKHRRQILNKILSLCQNPTPADSQPLKGTQLGERRATVGEYRIIYWVVQSEEEGLPDILYVGGIGKRNDDEVYRRFAR